MLDLCKVGGAGREGRKEGGGGEMKEGRAMLNLTTPVSLRFTPQATIITKEPPLLLRNIDNTSNYDLGQAGSSPYKLSSLTQSLHGRILQNSGSHTNTYSFC